MAQTYEQVVAAFAAEDGGSLGPAEAELAAATILSGENLVVGFDVVTSERAVSVGRRAAGLFDESCGQPFVLTEELLAAHEGAITGGPTVEITRTISRAGEPDEVTVETVEQPPVVPEDVCIVVLDDLATLDPSVLGSFVRILGDDYVGSNRSMNWWGRMVELRQLHAGVLLARLGQPAYPGRIGGRFAYEVDAGMVLAGGERDFEDLWLEEDDVASPLSVPVGPPLITRATLDEFQAASTAVNAPSEVLEEVWPMMEAMCRQAKWALAGTLGRISRLACGFAVLRGSDTVTVDEIRTAIRARATGYQVLSGEEPQLGEVDAAAG